jgi:hypothetical protein
MGDERRYQKRYCCFVDILGFRQLIEELRDGRSQFEDLRSLLRKVHSPLYKSPVIWGQIDLRVQSISDAVAISATCNEHGFAQVFHSIQHLTLDLLKKGFFIRGAIAKGMLYHDGEMVFGEALVEAYRLESEVARFPRIMLAPEVADDVNGFTREGLGISRSEIA